MTQMPAITLVATPGRRVKMVELAREAEKRGFTGIYVPSLAAAMQFCQSVLEATSTIEVATSIQPIYYINPREMARIANYLHEIGNGRFRLGLGVSHEVSRVQFGVEGRNQPVSDTRDYVAAMRAAEADSGTLPPIILATLRSKMLALAAEVAQGAVWANAARSYTPTQIAEIPQSARIAGFTTAVMIPTVISDDKEAAKEVHRRTLRMYLTLPNYRNYWRAAGYEAEMSAVEQAIADGKGDTLAHVAGDRWLSDVTLFGSAAEVREGVEARREAGITTPILVPSSTSGGMTKAADELFAAFA
ncbi:LLM class flavin-dependent oxidoreductase [Emcibacter sp. SYSU 3D8]|uniref:LLM class flavin-dependent oxidoreductase n=1 Tax=Emcibacter sp. SYSU 3D8 TaxID=3133969 RepID=UPI0031FF1787